jgi:hypothetical protein
MFSYHTACGSLPDVYSVYDFLDGTCAWSAGIPNPPTFPTGSPCNVKPFGMDCGSYQGTLFIVYVQKTAGVVQPNTQAYLDGMGLGNINSIYTLSITRFASDWDGGTITLDFLPSLVQATDSILITAWSDADPPFPVTASSGLANVRQVRGNIFEVNTLVTRPSWANLQCVGGELSWRNVDTQTTLEGMDKLLQVNYVPVYRSGEVITITGQSKIGSKEALAPLFTAANCGGVPPPLEPNIYIPAVCPNRIRTWDALCAFIATGACP